MTVWIAPVHDNEWNTGFYTRVNHVAKGRAVGVESDPHVLNIIDDPIQAFQPISGWTLSFTIQTSNRYACFGIAAVLHMLSGICLTSEAVLWCPNLLNINAERNQMVHCMGTVGEQRSRIGHHRH